MTAAPAGAPVAAEHMAEDSSAALNLNLDTSKLSGSYLLDRATLGTLNVCSNFLGLTHLCGHLLVLLLTGSLIYFVFDVLILLIPAMILHIANRR